MKTKQKQKLFSLTKKDFEVQTFRSGGKGGQNQNKVESGVRIVHRESGAVGESREERHQAQNKRIAFKRLTEHPKFKAWIKHRAAEVSGALDGIEETVDRQMQPENLRLEVKNSRGCWEKRTFEDSLDNVVNDD